MSNVSNLPPGTVAGDIDPVESMGRVMDRFIERLDVRREVEKGDNPGLTPEQHEVRRIILANILNREKDPLIEAIEDAIILRDLDSRGFF